MITGPIEVAPYAILAASLIAAITDLLTGKITNVLTLTFLVGGLVASVWTPEMTLKHSVLGAFVGFIALIGPYCFGVMGGGDVKFLAALGAWIGVRLILDVFLCALLFHSVIAVIQLASRGQLRSFIMRVSLFFIPLFSSSVRFQKPDLDSSATLPFGIPLAIAASLIAFGVNPALSFGFSMSDWMKGMGL